MKLSIDSTDNLKTVISIDSSSYTKTYTSPRDQDVLGAIKEALIAENCTLNDITEVLVKTGPGSFTGIRVGVSIGQALAYALNIPVNGQTSMEGIDIRYGGEASVTWSDKNS